MKKTNPGGRPPITTGEQSEIYRIRLPKELKRKCLEAGPDLVRDFLKTGLATCKRG
jgi:hypothetical protein